MSLFAAIAGVARSVLLTMAAIAVVAAAASAPRLAPRPRSLDAQTTSSFPLPSRSPVNTTHEWHGIHR
jgi:hypothetical protein